MLIHKSKCHEVQCIYARHDDLPCRGPKCAAWRWSETVPENPWAEHGFCGEAGPVYVMEGIDRKRVPPKPIPPMPGQRRTALTADEDF